MRSDNGPAYAPRKRKTGTIIGRILLVFGTTVLAIVLALVITLATIMKGPSEAAKEMFTTTVLESGNLKFLASVFLSADEIQAIVDKTSMKEMETDQNTELINRSETAQGNFDENGVEIVEISGRTYTATMMIVQDPSKVICGTTFGIEKNGEWGEFGETLDVIVKHMNAIGGVNGGIYAADKNKGGTPYGICVSNGQVQLNKPERWTGLYLIGFDRNDLLRIEKIEGWTAKQFQEYVDQEGIRDAVAFQEESSDKNNHFVPLVINGEARELNGTGSGANPRTVIGQRADGAVLLLVTDGRGSAGHLGATASDLISIMMEYGAVNAANLDGGSSSCMYYEDTWLRNSVTLYYANSSWRLPTSFVVMEGGDK